MYFNILTGLGLPEHFEVDRNANDHGLEIKIRVISERRSL